MYVSLRLVPSALRFCIQVRLSISHDIDVEELNIEFKDNKITEIHLRSGNDIALLGNIGTEFYPIWKGDDYSHLDHLEFVPNLDEEEDYSADGNLKDIRLGYYKK